MNEKTYTDKTNVSSEADLTSDEETTITKTSNQNTESSATELLSDEETNSNASKRKPSEISPPELQPQPKIELENGNRDVRIAKKGEVRPGCSEFTSWLS